MKKTLLLFAVATITCLNSFGGSIINNTNKNDRTLCGDVTGDGKDELILINVEYHSGSIRAINFTTGGNAIWINFNYGFLGYFDDCDEMRMGDVNGDGKDELILIDKDNNSGYPIRVIDMTTGNNISLLSRSLLGWTDPSDKLFVGDINGDNKEELILINTEYRNGAILAINLITGKNISYCSHAKGFIGWMDATDRMLLGDINGDKRDDLILINTDYINGAIRAINIQNGESIKWLNHGSFSGWMDPTDRMLVGDVNGDKKDELVLVNTSYSGGAIRAVNFTTGGNAIWVNHGSFDGWMDANDETFLKDINADGKVELVLVNTSYGGGAIRAINLTTGGSTKWINHGSFAGWMDSSDRMLMLEANGDDCSDLCFINTSYTSGAVRVVSIVPNQTIFWKNHDTFGLRGWVDGTCPYTTNANALKNAKTEFSALKKDDNNINDINIFPNPSRGQFTINNLEKNATIKIYDTSGAQIENIENTQDKKLKINLQKTTPGLYLIQITNNNKRISKKLIIK